MGQKQESYREVTFIQRSSMEYTGGRKQVKGEGGYIPGSSELCRPQTQSLSPDQSVVQYTKTVHSLANVILGAVRLKGSLTTQVHKVISQRSWCKVHRHCALIGVFSAYGLSSVFLLAHSVLGDRIDLSCSCEKLSETMQNLQQQSWSSARRGFNFGFNHGT